MMILLGVKFSNQYLILLLELGGLGRPSTILTEKPNLTIEFAIFSVKESKLSISKTSVGNEISESPLIISPIFDSG